MFFTKNILEGIKECKHFRSVNGNITVYGKKNHSQIRREEYEALTITKSLHFFPAHAQWSVEASITLELSCLSLNRPWPMLNYGDRPPPTSSGGGGGGGEGGVLLRILSPSSAVPTVEIFVFKPFKFKL
jgi:hypothetical protein